jgi:hypothetical protein
MTLEQLAEKVSACSSWWQLSRIASVQEIAEGLRNAAYRIAKIEANMVSKHDLKKDKAEL